ncbi:dynein light chain Tctex-type protein 2B-like isoform X1 [Leptopilina boulardi]|uniref:dynein light chain Tctex-type protein 2B-like isoform X1 n=1 Tax=Leptopilina boulardi TaxID=63433 RepID=UPI0021F64DC5|nr:dynein light chain Tctex-type protein 2B-like isoform X1 [Leptopilina boulardi]
MSSSKAINRDDGKSPRGSSALDRLSNTQSSHGSDQLNRKSLSGLNVPTGNFFRKLADGSWMPRYQNSYRLEPYNRFNPEVADSIIKNIMVKKLSTLTLYDPTEVEKLITDIINEVLKALIKRDYDRCKLVVQASVVQNAFQGINVGLGCLCDSERDNYSYYVYENIHIHAWCMAFAVYYE